MGAKFQFYYASVVSFIWEYQVVSAILAVILLFSLYKIPKRVFQFAFLGTLALISWTWFQTSFEKKDQNTKFKKYAEERKEVKVEEEQTGE